jgi:hypothetical protein
MPNELTPAYRRNLAATCRRVEQSLIELEELLQQQESPAITRHITHSYSDEKRVELLAAVHEVRRLNESLFHSLHLKATTTDEKQIVNAKFSQLWTILIDNKPNVMKGAGDIPEEEAKIIEKHIGEMVASLNYEL